MSVSDGLLRAEAFEAYENIPSLDAHGELARLILAEVSLLTGKYRNVRRHDVPHIKELAGLLDVLWQEVEMEMATAGADGADDGIESLPLFRWASHAPMTGPIVQPRSIEPSSRGAQRRSNPV